MLTFSGGESFTHGDYIAFADSVLTGFAAEGENPQRPIVDAFNIDDSMTVRPEQAVVLNPLGAEGIGYVIVDPTSIDVMSEHAQGLLARGALHQMHARKDPTKYDGFQIAKTMHLAPSRRTETPPGVLFTAEADGRVTISDVRVNLVDSVDHSANGHERVREFNDALAEMGIISERQHYRIGPSRSEELFSAWLHAGLVTEWEEHGWTWFENSGSDSRPLPRFSAPIRDVAQLIDLGMIAGVARDDMNTIDLVHKIQESVDGDYLTKTQDILNSRRGLGRLTLTETEIQGVFDFWSHGATLENIRDVMQALVPEIADEACSYTHTDVIVAIRGFMSGAISNALGQSGNREVIDLTDRFAAHIPELIAV